MKTIGNISAEAYQQHTITLLESEMTLKFRFFSRNQFWTFDIVHPDFTVNGVKISAGVRHLKSSGRPIDFICQDASGNGLDPFRIDDFSSGRCVFGMLEETDVQSLALGDGI